MTCWFNLGGRAQNYRTRTTRRRCQPRGSRKRRWDGFAGPFGAFERLEDRRLLAADATTAAIPQQAVQAQYGQLPLAFEANQGQTDSQVDFLARGAGYAVYLTGGGAVIDLQQATAPPPSRGNATAASPTGEISGTAIRMQFVDANPGASVTGLDKQQAVSNYLIGNDPSQWHTGVANFGQVEYQNLYAGISAVFHGDQHQVEYDFNVAPGADPKQIQWQLDGASGLSLDGSGNLLIHTAGGELLEQAPTIYQEANGARVAVSGRFVLEGDRVGFALGSYDASRPLVIDPTLSYASYLGGVRADSGKAIAVDGAGNAYVTGVTASSNFPATVGAYQVSLRGAQNVFVTKLSADGGGLLYSTFLGGSGDDEGQGIAVDGAGSAYVTGFTSSTNFPATPGAYQIGSGGFNDAFVAKLSADGASLIYSTYLGGNGNDAGAAIAIDGAGNAYVTGDTLSTNFPTTPGAYQTTLVAFQDSAFVTKLDAGGGRLLYSTFLGGGGQDKGNGIAVDAAGEACVAGVTSSTDFPTTPAAYQTTFGGVQDAFATKLDVYGRSLVYSTYLGGSGSDGANGIALDAAGNAYVTGATSSANFPTKAGAFQLSLGGAENGFVTKLVADGRSLTYSTYLGGGSSDYVTGIAVDGGGAAYLTGYASSTNFPTTPGAFQTSPGGPADAFVTKLSASGGALQYSSRLGGSAEDSGQGIAIDSSGSAYVTGYTLSTNFPATPGAYQTTSGGAQDAFVAKFQIGLTTPIDIDPAPNVVAEGAPTGTYVSLTAYSTDSAGAAVSYSLAGDSSGGGFQIDPVSGRVTVADGGKIIYDVNPSHAYTVIVQATAGGLTALQAFTISVTFNAARSAQFVSNVYSDLLNRPVDAGGLAAWVGRLAAGESRFAVVLGIEQSLEYEQDVVESLYSRYLHRPADAGGLSYFTQLLSLGVTVEQVAAALAGSSEFFIVQGGGTNDGFLHAFYQDALGRPIDAGGLAWWNAQLVAGMSRTQVANAILASDEYRQNLIESAYQHLLGRNADAGGLAFWLNALKAGATDQQLNAGLAGSAEYYAKTA
ncbi:MAG TPA: SBBP repeat-containing protein [Pirellulales bacterium]|nr:SBBP repeat-containing protein [Pirellulales bacterium]